MHDENYRDIRHIYQDGEERFEYNKLNQKTLVVDKMGNKTQFGYDGRGNLTRIINALGIKTELQYNKRDKPVYMAVNGIEKVRYYYDEKGNINEVKDALGNVFKLRYDEKERPGGYLGYVTIDALSFDEMERINGNLDGFQFGVGVGGGMDIHLTETYTEEGVSWNSFDSIGSMLDFIFGKNQVEKCIE